MAPTLPELERNPHPTFARLRETDPVAWIEPLGAWVVLRRDLALTAMRDSARFTVDDPRFTTARVVGPSMLSLDGAAHDRHRAPFARPFRKDAVLERFTGSVRAQTDELIDAMTRDDRREAELKAEFAGPLATATTLHALGLDHVDTDAVLGWYRAIVASVEGLAQGKPPTPAGATAFAALSDAIGGDDDSLIAAAAGQIDGDALVSNAAVMLFGGIETTEGMIANAARHLLAHGDQLELVRAQPDLLPNALEESLRLEPAAATIDRYATGDADLGGAPIRKGDLVTISIAAANRDPAVFPDPDRFDVTRPNAKLHAAFAHGPHVCIGMHLARLEAHTALDRLLKRLPGLRMTDPAAAEPRGVVFRKPPELRVAWD